MNQDNKTQKIFLAIIGAFSFLLIIFGIKLRDDDNKLKNVENSLKSGLIGEEALDLQKKMSVEREKTLNQVTTAPDVDITETTTTTKVVPGKVVPKTQTVKVPTTTKKTKTS